MFDKPIARETSQTQATQKTGTKDRFEGSGLPQQTGPVEGAVEDANLSGALVLSEQPDAILHKALECLISDTKSEAVLGIVIIQWRASNITASKKPQDSQNLITDNTLLLLSQLKESIQRLTFDGCHFDITEAGLNSLAELTNLEWFRVRASNLSTDQTAWLTEHMPIALKKKSDDLCIATSPALGVRLHS